jgi:signal transduction histidine kinase/CheY-like chemotaxis protein/HPt (histidine-containing phosphotransfer) domain-containing protein
MALHRRFALIALALTAGYLLLGFSILRTVVYPSFAVLEHRAARIQVARVNDTFRDIELKLSLVNMDWAQWDDSVEFIRAPVGSETYEAYEKANLKISDMVSYDLDLLLLFDGRDRLVWGQFLDDDDHVVPLEEVLIAPFRPGDLLLAHEDPVGSINGLFQTRFGPAIISSRPIVPSTAESPPEGTMIMGRLLDADRVALIERQTASEFHLFQTAHDEMAPDVQRAFDSAPLWPEDPFHEVGDEILLTYSRIDDVYGQPALLLQMRAPREITAAGATTLQLAAFFLLLASALFVVGLWLLLRRLMAAETQRSAMRKARDAALEVARLKGEFLATMSHEMRTPMHGVIGYSDLLMNTELTGRQRDFAENIQRSAEGLLHIIDDVLDFSKIDAGKVTSEVRDFELRALLEDVASMFVERARQSGLELACHVSPELDGVWRGDADRLRQVLINLLGNAFKFTMAGEVSIRAHGISEAEGSLVRIEVRDTGVGIEPGQQESIFEPFTQADASTTREFGGTGLGLAICKRIAELMGGGIGVESELGEGSTFWLELPLERNGTAGASDPTGEGARKASDEADSERKPALEGRILLVEDNPVNQRVAAAMLQDIGCDVDAALDGREALSMLERNAYDAVLMDCQMPVLDGYETTAALRRLEAERGAESPIPVIALTANAVEGDRERCLAAGMNDYVSKPFKKEQLRDIVEHWLSGGAVAPASGAPASRGELQAEWGTEAALDRRALDMIREIESPECPNLLGDLVRTYRQSSRELLEELGASIRDGDAERMARAAYALKSSSANLGAGVLASLSLQLERLGRAGELSGAKDLFARLTDEHPRVLRALEAELRADPR